METLYLDSWCESRRPVTKLLESVTIGELGHVERNPPRYRCDVSGFDGEDGRRLLNGLLVDQDGFGEEPS